MTYVFIAGSRQLSRLNEKVKDRLKNMVNQNFHILVGDANGIDKALQKYLSEVNYSNVTVYCSGEHCRNNIGNWSENKIKAENNIKGRKFYTIKDLAMAEDANYGFMIWDGKSLGTIKNILELINRNKKAVVYLSSKKEFINISNKKDAYNLINKSDKNCLEKIKKNIDFNIMENSNDKPQQNSMDF